MNEFSPDDRQAICDTFERLLADKANEETLRQVVETDAGFDASLWQQMADLGLTGIMIAPEQDGVGGSIEEAEQLLEVAGGFLYNGPFISTCVMAPILLSACTDQNLATLHLKNIAAGSSIFAVAGCGMSGDWTTPLDVIANDKGGQWELTGSAHFVAHGRNADYGLVYANTPSGVGVFLVDLKKSNILISPQQADDPTLRVSTLTFDSTPATKLTGVGEADINLALKSALVAFAGEQVGATRRIFDLTIEYLNTRFQFGQPIGRFQALKHMAADLLIEVESSSTVARHAARALASGTRDSALLTYLAAFTCADNFRAVAADAIQLHGGIAYTMEHPAHLYWRRAQTGQWLFGSSDRFRDLYLTEMEAKL
jgi:alkylation response protein AidB-like acyl-CoA dehydrogenase